MRQRLTMQEFDPDQLEQLVHDAQDPDLLKELMAAAIHAERDDLVDIILERSIRLNRLVEKLQDYQLQPLQATQISFVDASEAEFDETVEESETDPYA
jgi:hypothetical protein